MREYCNTEITILWLGQHLTTDVQGSGSRAAAEVHDRVREDLLVDDIADEGLTIRRDLLTCWCAKFGDATPVPLFGRSLPQSIDSKKLAETLAIVGKSGRRGAAGVAALDAGDSRSRCRRQSSRPGRSLMREPRRWPQRSEVRVSGPATGPADGVDSEQMESTSKARAAKGDAERPCATGVLSIRCGAVLRATRGSGSRASDMVYAAEIVPVGRRGDHNAGQRHGCECWHPAYRGLGSGGNPSERGSARGAGESGHEHRAKWFYRSLDCDGRAKLHRWRGMRGIEVTGDRACASAEWLTVRAIRVDRWGRSGIATCELLGDNTKGNATVSSARGQVPTHLGTMIAGGLMRAHAAGRAALV